jgi:DNA (cytosine-5)-methyltransferase 1
VNRFPKFKYVRSSTVAPRSLDLFSGAGGLSLGFLLAGGQPFGAVDFDQDSISTFAKNFPMARHAHATSIEDWIPSKIESGVDVIFGGPPCQGFSLARGLRFVDDPRNSLYKHFVRVVKRVRPEWVVMENVEGLLSIGEGDVLKQVLEDFERVGYELHYKVVNMAKYGVPQSRRRAIFVGNRTGKRFNWPDENFMKLPSDNAELELLIQDKSAFTSVNAALGDLNLSQGNYFAHRANSQMRGPRNRNANLDPAFTLRVRGDEFALCEKPAKTSFIPQHRAEEPIRFVNPKNEFQEIMQNRPGWIKEVGMKLVSRSSRPLVSGSRYLTLREQARIQSFPDWFEFVGVRTSQAKQIGNAVPPLFAAQLFKSLFDA